MRMVITRYEILIKSRTTTSEVDDADNDDRHSDLLQASDSRVDEPEYSQTYSTALQIAMVDFFTHLGVVPSAVVGHSSGEIAAA